MNGQDHTGKEIGPLIVFAGRSNVGKSSMIRALTGKKVLVGKRPGSTRWEQEIDMGSFIILDIPGFGFMAGQSKTTIEETKTRIIQNLERWSNRILLSVLIVDISLFRELYERWALRGEVPIDVEFYSFLCEITPRVVVVANKADKVKKHNIQSELEFLTLKLREAVLEREPTVIVTAALKRNGVLDLKDLIDEILTEEGLDIPRWAIA
ncbi:MAG: GTP-binding protein EngB [Candidatus Thorarchaeota archaeon]|nr:GTP-binding protein EngB [Candidatus Thorarchaeota archaeon]